MFLFSIAYLLANKYYNMIKFFVFFSFQCRFFRIIVWCFVLYQEIIKTRITYGFTVIIFMIFLKIFFTTHNCMC